MRHVFIYSIAACLSVATGAQAYTITNGSFEEPNVPAGVTSLDATGWSFFPAAPTGNWCGGVVSESWTGFGAGAIPDAPDGTQWLWLDQEAGGSFHEVTSQFIGNCEAQNQDIMLGFYLGTTDTKGQANARVEIADPDNGWATIDYIELTTPASQGSAYHTVTFNTGSTTIGHRVYLVLKQVSGGWAMFDQVEIIPDPATLAVVALGGVGLLLRRRRQR
jgi:hypothetical protein